jgi:hypothetical protein
MPFMPDFAGDYIDDYWMGIGRGFGGCHYLHDVKIRHEHAGAKNGITDETSIRRLNNNTTNDDVLRLPYLIKDALINIERNQGELV